MTNEKCLAVVSKYREFLEELGVEVANTDYDALLTDKESALNHLYAMTPKMEKFIEEGRRDKFFR